MGLLNVRLDAEMARKVKALREEGLIISDLIRNTVNQAYSKLPTKRKKTRLATLQQLHSDYPSKIDNLPERYNLADRTQMRAAMLERLSAKARRSS